MNKLQLQTLPVFITMELVVIIFPLVLVIIVKIVNKRQEKRETLYKRIKTLWMLLPREKKDLVIASPWIILSAVMIIYLNMR